MPFFPKGNIIGATMCQMAKNLNLETLNKFLEWLNTEEDKRGMTDYQVAKHAGIAPSVLSKARSGIQAIGWDACVAIAKALDLPPVHVLEKAGHLPETKTSPLNDEIIYLMGELPLDEQNEILAIARMKIEKQKRNQTTNRSNGNPAPARP